MGGRGGGASSEKSQTVKPTALTSLGHGCMQVYATSAMGKMAGLEPIPE